MQYRTVGRTGVRGSSPALGARRSGATGGVVAPGVDPAPEEEVDHPPALLDPALRRR